ncbi:AAA family ATPase [Lusitaniella coriacea LEGE 07157]|uniref:AAA family ATPase n=1 Tax=Lusitaniella coriacea LEGE 07157 TaxID=945747 RepID=A0A8J7DX00_9CYAN|nr:AAA family ATPase [Lusitaniella coriacea]MBE9116766.1 AAA family ATPase [Lusitaniella coriacea LEGE 07157]
MQAIIFVGIQASGKSTFYDRYFFHTHIRINLDMLKTRHREKRLLETCLEITQSFVVDNTNPTPEERKRYIDPAKNKKTHIIGYYFESKIADSIQRNQNRSLERQIPEKGIRGTHTRLVIPKYEEGFDELYYVRLSPENGFIVENWVNEI